MALCLKRHRTVSVAVAPFRGKAPYRARVKTSQLRLNRRRDPRIRAVYSQVNRRRGRPNAKVAATKSYSSTVYIILRDGIGYEEFRRQGEVACARDQESCVATRQSLET